MNKQCILKIRIFLNWFCCNTHKINKSINFLYRPTSFLLHLADNAFFTRPFTSKKSSLKAQMIFSIFRN